MVSILGTGSASSASFNAWQTARPLFSEDGAADSLTAPMLMNITNVAGQVCADLIASETSAASPRMYSQWNFKAGPASLTSAAINDAIRRFSRQVWGRNETEGERQMIYSAVTSNFSGTAASDTSAAAMMICVAFMGSFNGVQR